MRCYTGISEVIIAFPQPTKKWFPNNEHLIKEIIRRKIIFGDSSKTRVHTKTDDAITWLIDNPITDPNDVFFVSNEVEMFLEDVAIAEKDKEDSKKHMNWVGMDPHLRLIHCIVDDENIRKAYVKSLDVKTIHEVDGNNNTLTKRIDP